MILVDTSVLISFLKGQDNDKTRLFEIILQRDIPFGISAFTYMEVLQGARDESEYKRLKSYLSTQTIYYLPEERATYETAARMYFDLRRTGITPRSTIDIMIAMTAISNKLSLLHNDKDFDVIAEKLEGFSILKDLP